MQATDTVYGLSTLHNEMEQQKKRLLAFEESMRFSFSEANGEIIQTKRLQEEIKDSKAQANTVLGQLRDSIAVEDAAHRDLNDEMYKFKITFESLREKLTEETIGLELCAYENHLVLRTLQIDITPASISVPITAKMSTEQAKSVRPNMQL
jgi:hypothetical protein